MLTATQHESGILVDTQGQVKECRLKEERLLIVHCYSQLVVCCWKLSLPMLHMETITTWTCYSGLYNELIPISK